MRIEDEGAQRGGIIILWRRDALDNCLKNLFDIEAFFSRNAQDGIRVNT